MACMPGRLQDGKRMKDREKLMTNYLTLYENAVGSTALISFDMKSLTMYMPTTSGPLTEFEYSYRENVPDFPP